MPDEPRIQSASEEWRRVADAFARDRFPQFLKSVKITGLKGFEGQQVDFIHPVTVIAGENGSGKTTVLKAAACSYLQDYEGQPDYRPADLFPSTHWDTVEGARIDYSYQRGADTYSHYLNKPSDRWRGAEVQRPTSQRRRATSRPTRSIVFLDLSRTVPAEHLVGYAKIIKNARGEAASRDLSAQAIQIAGYVLDRTYDQARIVTSDVDARKEVAVVRRDFGAYSQFHQGAGEHSVIALIDLIDRLPRYSLLLVDELELAIHPRAQRRLVHALAFFCRAKQLQAILTSHSFHVLDSVPEDSRVLVQPAARTPRILSRATPNFCLSQFDDDHYPDLVIFVEDDEAKTLVTNLLVERDNALAQAVSVSIAGPSDVVKSLGQAIANGALNFSACAVLDADATAANCVSLPGTEAPEREVIGGLLANPMGDVSTALGRSEQDVRAALDSAVRLPELHEWIEHIAGLLRLTPAMVWETLSRQWVLSCMAEEAGDTFVARVKSHLPAN